MHWLLFIRVTSKILRLKFEFENLPKKHIIENKKWKSPIGDQIPISDFELGIGVFRIRDCGFRFPYPENTNPKFKLINW